MKPQLYPFQRIARDARRWLDAPSEASLRALAERARDATERVPHERRADWQKLVDGMARDDVREKQKARVEGLVRACALFSDEDPAPAFQVTDETDRLPGLGPTAKDVLAERGIRTVGDLVWTLPVAWDDLRAPRSIADAMGSAMRTQAEGAPSERVCIAATVKSASLVPMKGRRFVRVTFADSGPERRTLQAAWFFAAHGILATATPGKAFLVVGRVRIDEQGRARMAHPDVIADVEGARVVRPRYPRLGVPEAALRKAIGAAIHGLADPPDPVPGWVRAREGFPACAPLLTAAHGKGGVLDAPPSLDVRRALQERLAWGEALALVWERVRVEGTWGEARAPVLPESKAALGRFRAELGFALTGSQTRAIASISRDLSQRSPMRRLLLGDVGTGKTAVALAAAAQCVAAGWQVAILAPTSVLAEQYMDAVAPLARASGAAIALVLGGGGARRKKTDEEIAKGTLDVVIGTHALLGEGLTFQRLGLVIVDEQHRLGVAQRLELLHKAQGEGEGTTKRKEERVWPHLLTLSATPIPRTMALAIRGELATSVLEERPAGRVPTATEMRPRSDLAEIVELVRAAASREERVFWVCPRIEDDDEDEDGAPSAVARAAELARALAPIEVVLVHGGLKPETKRRAMRAFRSGKAQVLVGTTVVEVGVDVPDATLMVVEGAGRFGLAQLHQLRGRVGRGARPGRCILLVGDHEGELSRRRLEAVCKLTTGEEIARADLELRGAGDLGGTRQSGEEASLFYLDPASPPAWLPHVEADARTLFAQDPCLERPEHQGLALFLRRFGAAIAVRAEAG